jgi:predicted Zn-dependent protease
MSRRLYRGLLTAAIFLIPAGVGVAWWEYWPTYHRRQLLREAEQDIQADNLVRAEEILRQLIREDPDQLRPQYLHAQVLRRLGRRQEAWTALYRAIQQGLPEADGLREYALLEAGDDFARAEGALRRVLDERPDDVEAWQALAQGYARYERWFDAERAYGSCLEIQPDRMDLHLERGQVLIKAGRLEQAATDFRRALRLSPENFQARLLLAHCLLSDARIEEAEGELLQCRRLQPARSEPLVGLATCAAERGDLDRAQALVQEALALEPASPLALHLQGSLYLRRRRYDQAAAVFERILRRNPRDKVAHLNLAQALSHGPDKERAREHERLYQQLDREEDQRLRREHSLHPD